MSIESNKIRVIENPNYRTINVAGAIGSFHELGIQVTFYSEELDGLQALSENNTGDKKLGLKRTIECRLALDPYGAVDLRDLLDDHIARYEAKYGKILIDKQDDKDSTNNFKNPLAQ